ncbi:MAG: transglycosylase domain-containing protein, partial [Patescibacteria group bacterium]
MRVKKGALVPKKRMVLALLFAFLLAGAAGTALLAYYVSILPRPEALEEIAPRGQTTQLYDRTGKVLLYEIRGEEKRIPVALEDLPPFLPQAVLAAEDGNFYNHFGLDMPGILRAVGVNLRSGAALQGGSTITQQLARSAFLTREKTLDRKLKELILTLDLELRYSKDAILELYLNQVPLGSNVYGVGAASEFYFGKPAQELSLRESATIAAMIRAPSFYSPFHEENAPELEARVAHVLATMTSIPPEELAQALQEPLGATPMLTHMKAPHFVFAVLDELEAKYGTEFLRVNGLKVFTTLDWELQKAAEEAVERYAARNRAFNAHNAALVALDPATGELKALVGSLGWFEEPSPAGCSPGLDCVFDPKVNAAAPSHGRQPGSAFKPFVYATAFEKGATAETVVVDEETNFGVWGGKEYVPQNYDGTFRGEVTLRQALAQSLNIPSVKVLMELAGIEESIATAHAMGIRTLQGEYGPSLVLGAG